MKTRIPVSAAIETPLVVGAVLRLATRAFSPRALTITSR